MSKKETTLYSPKGEKYVTEDRVEATRLRMAHGYTEKAPKQASESSGKSSGKSDGGK